MPKPQIITSPSGEELVVLPRRDYEDLVDALAARKAETALLSQGGPRAPCAGRRPGHCAFTALSSDNHDL